VTDWWVIALFAAFVGFNWEWALEKFRYTAEAAATRMTEKGSTAPGGKAGH
jgi:hypothetical protein